VHVFEAEREAAVNPSLRDRMRYRAAHVAHGPRWVTHAVDGDSWLGFDAVRVLPGIEAEIALIPLPGHSRGHTGVAVRDGERWLLHCGDTYFHHGEMADPPIARSGCGCSRRRWRSTTARGVRTRSGCATSPAATPRT
jgi:glyoxylase-like metal-dependent hydrolase (beta-lactamase superfamily II)